MRDKTWTTIWSKVETIYTANILSCINDAPAVFRTLFRQGDSFDFFFFLFNKNSWTEHRWIREKIFFFTIEKNRWSNSKNLFYFSRRRRFFYHWLYAVRFLFFFFRWFDLVWKQFIANLLHFWLNVNINTCYIFPSEELLSQEIIFMIINNFYACMQIEKLHVLFLIR